MLQRYQRERECFPRISRGRGGEGRGEKDDEEEEEEEEEEGYIANPCSCRGNVTDRDGIRVDSG